MLCSVEFEPRANSGKQQFPDSDGSGQTFMVQEWSGTGCFDLPLMASLRS